MSPTPCAQPKANGGPPAQMQGGAQVIKGQDLGSWSGSASDTPGMIFPSQGTCIPGDGELHWRNPEKLQVRWSTCLARDSACRRC